MAILCAAIYEDYMIARANQVDHSIVAHGYTSNVKWLVTDTIVNDIREVNWNKNGSMRPGLVRTITIKGFDATDGHVDVDREKLLEDILTASPEEISEKHEKVRVHSGLLSIAKEIYIELEKFIDGLSPGHKLIINGHSIGGSLSHLILMLLAVNRGPDWVKSNVLKVFTFGSPPIACIHDDLRNNVTIKDH